MRIDRLGLTRYGHFDDQVIEFPTPTSGIDLHIVYGDNEAGKSTTYQAVLDLLFGIAPKKPAYAFKHARNALRIDATLRSDAGTLSLARIGRGLIDEHDASLDELVLAPLLGGLDRASFTAMFSMDETALEQGGRDILASKGDLGRVLFSAGSGLGDLDTTLDRLLDERASYYQSSAKRADWPLSRHLARIKAIDEELKTIDVRSDEWRARTRTAEDCAAAFTDAQSLTSTHRTQVNRLTATAGWRLRAIELIALQHRYEDVAEGPVVPASWWQDLDEFVIASRKVMHCRDTLLQALQPLEEALQSPLPDRRLLDADEEIEALAEQHRCDALERIRLERDVGARNTDHSAATTLATTLGLSGSVVHLQDPLLDDALRDRCREALLALGPLTEAQRGAREELAGAEQRLEQLPAEDEVCVPDVESLDRAITAIEAAPDARPANEAQERRQTLHDALDVALAALLPWTGAPTELVGLRTPTDARLDTLRGELQDAVTRSERDATSRTDITSERQARRDETPGPDTALDDDTWTALKEQHWLAWRDHRDALAVGATQVALSDTAARFEAALRDSERMGTRREASVQARIEQRSCQEQLALLDARLQALDERASKNKVAKSVVERAIDELATTVQLPAGTGIDRLIEWHRQRKEVLSLGCELTAVERRIAEREATRQAHGMRLDRWFAAHEPERPQDPDASLEERLARARACVASGRKTGQEQQARNLSRKVLLAEIARRETTLQSTSEQLDAWRHDWQTLVQDSVLARAPLAEATSRLNDISTLAAMLDRIQRHDLAQRRLDETNEAQQAAVQRLCERLGSAFDMSATDLMAALLGALDNTRTHRDERQQQTREHARVRTELQQLMTDEQARLDDIAHRFKALGVDSLDAMRTCIEVSRERQLALERIARDTALLLTEACVSPVSASTLESLAEIDNAHLESETEQAEVRADESATRRDERLAQWTRATDALDAIGDDNQVARLEEERRVLLLAIEESAHETLSLRLGVAAAREGMRRFRRNHRSDMLRDASDTFGRITDGHFTSLKAEPDDKGVDRLLAVSADGSSLLSDAMSTGTRFQLYLALRVAAYRRWCRHRTALPFVADDVLETFDDDRTALTFEAFHEMSRSGQVVYLTHHRHVVDIARRVTNGAVCVHELPRRLARPSTSND